MIAATTCSFHNSPLNAYYKKKREQGKHHLTATGAVARKLTTIIYAVFRDGKRYEATKFCYYMVVRLRTKPAGGRLSCDAHFKFLNFITPLIN